MKQKQAGNDQRPSGTEEDFIGRQVPQWAEEEEEEEEEEEKEEKRQKKKKKKST